MKNKNIFRIFVIVILILLLPLFGNFFIDGWNWSITDFVIMGGLLFITGLAIDLAYRKIARPRNKILTIFIIVTLFLITWITMATNSGERLFERLVCEGVC